MPQRRSRTTAPPNPPLADEPNDGTQTQLAASVISVFNPDFDTLNLWGKIARITGMIGGVEKRGYNAFHKYHYTLEADLVAAVRQYLAAANIVIIPSVVGETREGDLTKIDVEYTVTDGNEHFSFRMPGYGADRGDKGVYKAITGAQKYTLMKTFLIPTGDDPELEDAPAVKKPASGGKSAGKAKPTEEAQPTAAPAAPAFPLDVEGGEAKIPSGKLKDRTVNSLTLGEAEDLLGKLPKGGTWYKLIELRVSSLKAAAANPALAEIAATFGAVAVK